VLRDFTGGCVLPLVNTPMRGALAERISSAPRLARASRAIRPFRCFNYRKTDMSNFWDMVMLMVSTFFFIAYLIIMFQIVVDLFRDHELGGGSKVLWVIGLIFVPVVTAIVYIIARGRGMAERQQASVQKAKAETETYIKTVAGKSPAADIAEAKALLDAGTINQAEFDKLKAKALS
jgi:ABC-type multidrug transport system fused ATPase/permease subunit